MAPREVLVHDELEPCPYLDGEQARMPLRWQRAPLTPAELDGALAHGDRRVGRMLYRTSCPACHGCEPLRVPVAEFSPTKSQRRVWRKNQDIEVQIGPVVVDDVRLALFNRHKLERDLSRSGAPMTSEHYLGWFGKTCCRTVEMRYLLGDRLVGVGILDVGARDASSVYFYFDPDESRRSLGVFSAIYEIAWLRSRGGRYHYFGLYIERCAAVSYKADYRPHERLIGGVWRRVDEAGLVVG